MFVEVTFTDSKANKTNLKVLWGLNKMTAVSDNRKTASVQEHVFARLIEIRLGVKSDTCHFHKLFHYFHHHHHHCYNDKTNNYHDITTTKWIVKKNTNKQKKNSWPTLSYNTVLYTAQQWLMQHIHELTLTGLCYTVTPPHCIYLNTDMYMWA